MVAETPSERTLWVPSRFQTHWADRKIITKWQNGTPVDAQRAPTSTEKTTETGGHDFVGFLSNVCISRSKFLVIQGWK